MSAWPGVWMRLQWMPLKSKLQIAVSSECCSFDFNGIHVNLIDTPGYADFLGKALSVLEAVEAVAVVGSAGNGVGTPPQRPMEVAREGERCRVGIRNKNASRDPPAPALSPHRTQ